MRPDAHALVAAYAVDALDEVERADVRAHLDECPVCRDDLRGYRETAAVLAAATEEPPPARMREQVLARIRTTPQLPPLTAPGDAPAAGPVPPSDVPSDGRGSGDAAAPAPREVDRTASSTRPTVSRTLFGLAAGGLTVVALGTGIWGLSTADQLSDVRAQQAAVQRVLAADDVVSLSGTPQLGVGVQGDEVVVLASESADAALLLPAGLPAAPQGSTWQAWTVTGDQAVSAGVFDVRGGEAVALSTGVEGVDAVAVSLEPAGGSDAPTSDPVLVVPLA